MVDSFQEDIDHMIVWRLMSFTTVNYGCIAAARAPIHALLEFFTTQFQLLINLKNRAFENIVGKGENAGNQHFLHFSRFLPYQKRIISS